MTKTRVWVAAVAILGVGAFAVPALRDDESRTAPNIEAASLRLVVDLSTRQLSVVKNGETIESYPVAVGKPSYPTPKGSFAIRRIIWNPRWVPPDSPWAKKKKATPPGHPDNPMGKVKIFFSEPDYYIHGTRNTDSLGQAESHGCIRMRNGDVISLAQAVMAAGGKPVKASWVRKLVNKVRATREVRLSAPIPLTVRG